MRSGPERDSRPGRSARRAGIAEAILPSRKRRRLRRTSAKAAFVAAAARSTADGRLCFRYDAPDFRGFVIVSNFMALPAEPLPAPVQAGVGRVGWSDLFVDSEARTEEWRLVLVWAPWCTHCGEAFRELQAAAEAWRAASGRVSLFAAAEPNSRPGDVPTMTRLEGIVAPALRMKSESVSVSGAANQLPTVLLFAGDHLVGRKLGTQPHVE